MKSLKEFFELMAVAPRCYIPTRYRSHICALIDKDDDVKLKFLEELYVKLDIHEDLKPLMKEIVDANKKLHTTEVQQRSEETTKAS